MTYLITFACYGCRLHGDELGSVDPAHNVPGTPTVERNSDRTDSESERMDQSPYSMDHPRREAVLKALQEVCAHREWNLLAAHVRTNHVHTVVGTEVIPERIMADFKTYASRNLNRLGLDGPTRKRWARHGSTRWLWKPHQVSAAMRYVVGEQGEPMSVFESTEMH